MDCKELKCSGFDQLRKCRCYAKPGNEEQQYCGYNKNGLIIPCGVGCCDGGCPGQCKDVPFKPPFSFDTNVFNVEDFPLYLKVAALLVIALIIISTLRA
jgi:hypothetical protein